MGKEDKFAAFALPIGVTDGVEIPLGDTGAVFRVLLPSQANEDFQAAFMATFPRDAETVQDIDPFEVRKTRRQLFKETCLLDWEGIPGGMSANDFFAAYPLALDAIYNRAEELARQDDKAVQDALGNSEAGSRGPKIGEAA